MAIYKTTDTELTSIANAIRSKTGESSPLVYPTGFVNAINSISPYNWMGKDAELVSTLCDTEIALSSTSLGSWTPSSTTTVILDGTQYSYNSGTITNDSDYLILVNCYIGLVYTSESLPTPSVVEVYNTNYTTVGARPNGYNDWINDLNGMMTYDSSSAHTVTIYCATNGSMGMTASNYGIWHSINSPTVSNGTQSNFSINCRIPSLRVQTNSSYMTASSFQALDLTNSKYCVTAKLYRIPAHKSIFNAAWQYIRDMRDTYHNTN